MQTGENIEDLPGSPEFRDLFRRFADYWCALPKDTLIPNRRDFRPEELSDILSSVVIHELVRPDFIKLRLAGTAVVDSYGREITGKNYLDFVDEPRRAKASEAIHLICQQPCGMWVQIGSTTETGAQLVRESLAFPMRDHDGAARFVYFCSTPTQPRTRGTDEPDQLQVVQVRQRLFIDIGAGTPDFSD